jgi:hypothetical protein
MLLTVKHVVDAQQSGTGEKGALFVVDSVEMANVRGPKSDTAPLHLCPVLCISFRLTAFPLLSGKGALLNLRLTAFM